MPEERILARELVMSTFEEYADKYANLKMERGEDGILLLTLHTEGAECVWDERIHRELPLAFADIAADRENRCVIVTGTGDTYIGELDLAASQDPVDDDGAGLLTTPLSFHKMVYESSRLDTGFFDIQVPVIAAVNGPVSVHSDLAVMADIVLASENATFVDQTHFWNGFVPGDGAAYFWLRLLGPNRGRYWLYTAQQLSAQRAYELGVVAEVTTREALLDRAWEIAREIIKRPPLTVIYTKHVLNHEFKHLLQENAYRSMVLEGAAIVQQDGRGLNLLRKTTGLDPTLGFDKKDWV